MTKMREAVLAGKERVELRETEAPEAGAGRALVRVRNCGICGSDLHFYRGEFPAPPDVRLGHEIAGEVVSAGAAVAGVEPGLRVAIEPVEVCRECAYCLSGRNQLCSQRKLLGTTLPGGLAEYLDVPAYTLHPLPDGVDFETGALVEPLAVTAHGLRQVGLQFGERVAVLGAGNIGLLALVAAQELGATDVWITARYPHQAEAARALGATAVIEGKESPVAALREAFAGRPPEVVVETVGSHADTLNEAIALVAAGGRISVLGIFTGPVATNMTGALLKEASIVGGITYGQQGARSDFEVAIEIASRRVEDLRRLITHRVALDDVAGGFAVAADKSQGTIKVSVAV